MSQTYESLIQEIKEGKLLEHRYENVELKSDWQNDYGRKISSLANKINREPSWLVIGLNDNGCLCGKDEKWARNTEQAISHQINGFLNPIQSCKGMRCVDINGSWVVIVSIQSPGAVTYWDKIAYKASGTTSMQMMPSEIMEMTISLPGLHDYSAQEWEGECDPSLVVQFAEKICVTKKEQPLFDNLNKLPPDEILQRIGIKNRNAARILFGDFKFRVVYFSDSGKPLENNEFFGLFRLLSDDFIKTIQLWTKKESHLINSGLSMGSEDPYSNRALREAIANAVAHTAYFHNNGEIIVEIFPNKLCISNLCLPESMCFANKWFSQSHNTINNVLMEVLRLAGFVDELGIGKYVIFSEMIKSGKKSPIVDIEKAGQYNRWRLFLYDGIKDTRQLKLVQRVEKMYGDSRKTLVATSLVLWRDQSVASIKQYIDGESLPMFKEILSDLKGPIFYYVPEDKIVLRRWARVLLGEGKDSKHFTVPEEEDLRDYAYKIQHKFHKDFITPQQLRELADMGNTNSEKSLTSTLLKKWVKEGYLVHYKRGLYQFKQKLDTAVSDWQTIDFTTIFGNASEFQIADVQMPDVQMPDVQMPDVQIINDLHINLSDDQEQK